MAYSVEIGFAPANELFISLYAFLCKKIQKRLDLGTEWVTVTKAQLPVDFAARLEQVALHTFWHPLSILILQSPHKQTTADFLDWFADLSVGEMYERLVPYVSTFSVNLHLIREQMLELLAQWDECYFRHLDPRIMENLQNNQQKWAKIRYDDAVAFSGEVTNGCRFEPKEGLQQLFLIPQHHYSPFNLIHHFGASTICMYAVDALPLAEDEPPMQIARFTRCIADRSRMKIMRYLKEQPRTLNEITAYTGLAKSTVHDHVTTLRSAGLVMNHTVGETAAFYSLRPHAFRMLSGQVEQFLGL
ncbi:ArsR/SmtB family transcription factor [Brevibacillus fluminis]|uniref:ArsR/SmtB family transcription factor n=1 Tax=Brevibacillus fluminis TaxID=511487 RepID=UPI003F8AD718